jgi:hypothetical protein
VPSGLNWAKYAAWRVRAVWRSARLESLQATLPHWSGDKLLQRFGRISASSRLMQGLRLPLAEASSGRDSYAIRRATTTRPSTGTPRSVRQQAGSK